MFTLTTVTTHNELEQILRLQKRNLPKNLSKEEQHKEGFVTVQHSLTVLKAMSMKQQHIIAKVDNTVVGYALCMHQDFKHSIPILEPMFKEIDTYVLKTNSLLNYIVMGQICIAKAYRKQGVFKALYAAMKALVLPSYDCIITEVDAKNKRSLQAHYAASFKDLSTYTYNTQEWKLIELS